MFKKINDVARFFDVKEKGYKVNQWIFRVMFFLIFLGAGMILYLNDFSLQTSYYYNCPDGGNICYNPYYGVCDEPVCQFEFYPAGTTFGNKPSFLEVYFGWFIALLVIFALLLNHYLYNKDFRFYKQEEEKEYKEVK